MHGHFCVLSARIQEHLMGLVNGSSNLHGMANEAITCSSRGLAILVYLCYLVLLTKKIIIISCVGFPVGLLIGMGDKLENFDLIFFPTSKTWKVLLLKHGRGY